MAWGAISGGGAMLKVSRGICTFTFFRCALVDGLGASGRPFGFTCIATYPLNADVHKLANVSGVSADA